MRNIRFTNGEEGFTLIETIIYIALFSIMIGGIFVSIFQIMQNTYQLEGNNVLDQEMTFTVQKIDWLLDDLKIISIPSSGSSTNFSAQNITNENISLVIEDGRIKACKGGTCEFITSINVTADSLTFTHLDEGNGAPKGIKIRVELSGRTIEINKFLRI